MSRIMSLPAKNLLLALFLCQCVYWVEAKNCTAITRSDSEYNSKLMSSEYRPKLIGSRCKCKEETKSCACCSRFILKGRSPENACVAFAFISQEATRIKYKFHFNDQTRHAVGTVGKHSPLLCVNVKGTSGVQFCGAFRLMIGDRGVKGCPLYALKIYHKIVYVAKTKCLHISVPIF